MSNTGIMRELDIILPPIQLQRKFTTAIKKIVALKHTQEQLLKNSSKLFDSLIRDKIG